MLQGAAPVYSMAPDVRIQTDTAAWARFVAAADEGEFYRAWLALLAAGMSRPRALLLPFFLSHGTPNTAPDGLASVFGGGWRRLRAFAR